MTIERQIYFLNLIKSLIMDYKNAQNKQTADYYLENITQIITTLSSLLDDKYNNLFRQIEFILISENIIDQVYANNTKENLIYIDACNKFDLDDNYLKYLFSKVEIKNCTRAMYSYEITDFYIKKYLKNNKELLLKYYNDKENIIYDKSFVNSASMILKGKNIILLHTYDVTVLFHEFLHSIYPDIMNIYYETYSILGELGLQKSYKIPSSINRLEVINDYKKDGLLSMSNLSYLVATLLTYAIIEKYGNSFKDLYDIMNLIYNNRELNFSSMLDICTIKERDIIKGLKKNNKV